MAYGRKLQFGRDYIIPVPFDPRLMTRIPVAVAILVLGLALGYFFSGYPLHRLLGELCRQGLLVMAATHDLNLAAAYAGRVIVLDRGALAADASPGRALEPAILRRVFEVEAELVPGPEGRPWIRYET